LRADAEWLNRNALRFLGIALAVSLVIALPVEQLIHRFLPRAGTYWELHSCNTARLALDLGNILQALLTPILVFLLPGPGSILQANVARSVRPAAGPANRLAMHEPQMVPPLKPSAVIFAVILLILCLWVFLSNFLTTQYWFIEHLEMQPHPRRSALIWAIVLMAGSGLGIAVAIYLLCRRIPWHAVPFIALGWLFGGAIPVVWWYGLSGYAALHGLCTDLFDLGRFISPSAVDYLSDCAHYFIRVSVFAALWVGVTAGGLRLQSARAAEAGSSTDPLRRFQSFYWAYLLGWVVQYRLSQWFLMLFPWAHAAQGWPFGALMEFFFVTVSSLWALVLLRFLWKLKAGTRLSIVIVAFGGSFFIYLLTAVVSLWAMWAAGGAFAPLMSLNVFGLAWALFVANRYLHAQREQPAVAGMTAPS